MRPVMILGTRPEEVSALNGGRVDLMRFLISASSSSVCSGCNCFRMRRMAIDHHALLQGGGIAAIDVRAAADDHGGALLDRLQIERCRNP